MTAKDIISRAMLKRLTTDLARHLLDLDAEAVQVLETRNQRGRMGRGAPMNFKYVNNRVVPVDKLLILRYFQVP